MDVIEYLRSTGAVATDRHFVYTSGMHGSAYVNLDPVLPDVALMSRLCQELAAPFAGEAEVVIAPAVGAIVLAVLTAQALSSSGADVRAVWADKTGSGFAVERPGFAGLLRDRKTLVVEDLLTTGGSVRGVLTEARRHGAQVIGVSAVCNRGGLTAEALGVPVLHALAAVEFAAFAATQCPLCQANEPIVEDVGHGRGFREHNDAYAGGYVRLMS